MIGGLLLLAFAAGLRRALHPSRAADMILQGALLTQALFMLITQH